MKKKLSQSRRLLFPITLVKGASGGRKFLHFVVDNLNDCGIESYVVYPTAYDWPTWFQTESKSLCIPGLFPKRASRSFARRVFEGTTDFFRSRLTGVKTKNLPSDLRASDILLIPETRVNVLSNYPLENKKIIFNQNHFFGLHTDNDLQLLNKISETGEILGIVVASEINFEYQKFLYPSVRVEKVKLFVEEYSRKNRLRKRQVAYMPRRGSSDVQAVLNAFRIRNKFEDVEFVSIDGVSHDEVLKILEESLIFLSFANREGFGLPAAEAMAAGCIVIGYPAGGGQEFFNQEYCCPIEEGDIKSAVLEVERILEMSKKDPDTIKFMSESASSTISKNYSQIASRESIRSAFTSLVNESNTLGE